MHNITSQSYIVIRGKRRYLENTVEDIKFRFSLKGDAITLKESTLMTWREIVIKKADIQEFGAVS